MITFYHFYRSRSAEYQIVFAVADKGKALNGYFNQTKDNNISLKYTGRCGAEALIWCRDKLLEFENEVFLSETFETKIVVYGEDHRRFRFYERALTRYGYEKRLTDDGWAMVKKVLKSNYDTEVSWMIDVGSAYFCCDECPISEDVERRYRNADEAGAFQYDHCGCDKIDYPFFVGGYCDDAFCQKDDFERIGRRKTGKAYRRKMRVKKRNDLMRAIEGCYVRDIWHRKGAYIVYPKNSKAKKYYRNYSSRLVRRGKIGGAGKGGYRRSFDYKWEVY